MRRIVIVTMAALALPATALGGGWATAGVGPPPAGLEPGDTWPAEVKLLQHAVTPLVGVSPSLTIRGPDTRTFPARPTSEPGVYAADVVFPVAGSYRYEVDDGFGQVHTFGPVEVGGPVAAPGRDGFPGWVVAPVAVAALALGAAAVLLTRRRAGHRVPALD